MEITKLVSVGSGRTRTVAPLPEVDSAFTVTTREISDAEISKIYDRHNYQPGRKDKAAMQKLAKVTRDIIKSRVVSWENFTRNGEPIECDEDSKALLYEHSIVIDGEEKTLWQLVGEAEQRQKEDESGN
jgi:hypothetical protein